MVHETWVSEPGDFLKQFPTIPKVSTRMLQTSSTEPFARNLFQVLTSQNFGDESNLQTISGGGVDRMWNPRLDIYDTEDSMHIDMEVPGLTKEDLKLKLKEGDLEISGERVHEKKEGGGDKRFRRSERSYGRFVRRISLPSGVGAKDIFCKFENGVLQIKIPHPLKMEEEIRIEGGEHDQEKLGYKKQEHEKEVSEHVTA